MNKQYIVQVIGIKERKKFINYIKNNFKLKFHYSKRYMTKSNYPFVIDFKEKDFWVCESITCCACASQANRIISKEQFIETIK